ncbi:hypothetical protein F5883DRAFT_689980, partial [Diaporthe sp. PMI_573]
MSAQSTSSDLSPVMITGGCGFVGSHLAEGLLAENPNCQIHVIDVNTERNQVPGVHYHTCDITSSADVESAFVEIKPQTKRVYTLTKVEAEDDILAANRQGGDSSMLTVSIRPATAFGARDFGFMGKVIAQARAGKANAQIGPGKNYYDVTYISNLVDAHLLAAHALINAYGRAAPPLESQVDGQAFIITNDEPVLFWEFNRAVAASVGMPVKKEDIKVIPYWVAMLAATVSEWSTWIFSFGKKQALITREAVHLSTITRTLKCDKAKRILGYKPRIGVYEGLEQCSKWFVKEAKKTEQSKKV